MLRKPNDIAKEGMSILQKLGTQPFQPPKERSTMQPQLEPQERALHIAKDRHTGHLIYIIPRVNKIIAYRKAALITAILYGCHGCLVHIAARVCHIFDKL